MANLVKNVDFCKPKNLDKQFNRILDELGLREKLPRTAKENRTPSGKIRPMSKRIVQSLYNMELDINQFRRTARVYYRTHLLGNMVTLINEVTDTYIKIDFTQDSHGYIKIHVPHKQSVVEIKSPNYNSDLFAVIVQKNLFSK